MLRYQWQKLIMKKILVEFFLQLRTSKFTNFTDFFLCHSTISGKFMEYTLYDFLFGVIISFDVSLQIH